VENVLFSVFPTTHWANAIVSLIIPIYPQGGLRTAKVLRCLLQLKNCQLMML